MHEIGLFDLIVRRSYRDGIATRSIDGCVPFHMGGYNPDVDAAEETMWPVGLVYVFPTVQQRMEVVGGANDTLLGTGAQIVHVHYLDQSFAEHFESINMNGAGVVLTQAVNIYRILDFHVQQAGALGVAGNNIDLRTVGGAGNDYSRIVAGRSSDQQLVWTVPAGKMLYISQWYASCGASASGKFCEFRLVATQRQNIAFEKTPTCFQVIDMISMESTSVVHSFGIPITLIAGVDLMVRVKGDAANADAICMCGIEGWLEDL